MTAEFISTAIIILSVCALGYYREWRLIDERVRLKRIHEELKRSG